MMGYPFSLDIAVEYRLGAGGLRVRTTARNIGDVPCPYAAGQHPYLSPGSGLVDSCRLQLRAATWLPTDDRGIPTEPAAVDGSDVDFRAERPIGSQDVDYTFTGLTRDSDGLAWVVVTGGDGCTMSVWADEHYPYIEIYTSHTQPAPHWRSGLGVEPMTCPPNAFRSGHDLIRLEPGEAATASWGIRVQ
jgi:aldose 1-epimerase